MSMSSGCSGSPRSWTSPRSGRRWTPSPRSAPAAGRARSSAGTALRLDRRTQEHHDPPARSDPRRAGRGSRESSWRICWTCWSGERCLPVTAQLVRSRRRSRSAKARMTTATSRNPSASSPNENETQEDEEGDEADHEEGEKQHHEHPVLLVRPPPRPSLKGVGGRGATAPAIVPRLPAGVNGRPAGRSPAGGRQPSPMSSSLVSCSFSSSSSTMCTRGLLGQDA